MASVTNELGHFMIASGMAILAGYIFEAGHTTPLAAAPDVQQFTSITVPRASINLDATISAVAPTPTSAVRPESASMLVVPSEMTCLLLILLWMLTILCASWWLAPLLQEKDDTRGAERAFDEETLPESLERERIAGARGVSYASLISKCLPFLDIIDEIGEYRNLASACIDRLTNACVLAAHALTEADNAMTVEATARTTTRDKLSFAEGEVAQLQKQVDQVKKDLDATQDLLTQAETGLVSKVKECTKLREAQTAAKAELKELRDTHESAVNMKHEMLEKKTEEMNRLEEQSSKRLVEVKRTRKERDEARKQLQQAEQKCSGLQKALADEQESSKDAWNDLAEAHEQEVSDLDAELEQQKETTGELELALEDSKLACEEYQEEVLQYKQELLEWKFGSMWLRIHRQKKARGGDRALGEAVEAESLSDDNTTSDGESAKDSKIPTLRGVFMTPKVKTSARTKRGGKNRNKNKNKTEIEA